MGRFGGEEFLIVLTDLTEPQSQSFADKIITDIEEANLVFALNDQEAIVTISAGIHIIREKTGIDSETAIRSADRALYQAKRNGKDRYEIVYT